MPGGGASAPSPFFAARLEERGSTGISFRIYDNPRRRQRNEMPDAPKFYQIDQVWTIKTAVLTHSLDANGDLSTLAFGFTVDQSPRCPLRSAILVPAPMYEPMGGGQMTTLAQQTIDMNGNDHIGTYCTTGERGFRATLRTSQDAIFRMAQLCAGRLPLKAQIVAYETDDHSAGFIAGFTLDCIDLTPSD